MDRLTALINLSAREYLSRWRAAFTYRPGWVLLGGATIAWAASKYLRFLSHVRVSLASGYGASSVTAILVILGCLAALPILTMVRPAGRNSRWRLLPLNRRERAFTNGFQYAFQLGFVLLAFTAAVTAWICERDVNPGMWLMWVALATIFWASLVRTVYRSPNSPAGVLLAVACAGVFAAIASSPAVSRTVALVGAHAEAWQPRFWSLLAATLAASLVALGGGEALRCLISTLHAGTGLRSRSRSAVHRHWLTIWLKHEWHCWSGCLYPYVAILVSAPLLYYLCLDPHLSVIAASVAASFVAMIDGVPFTNIFGRESLTGLDRLAMLPVSGKRILDAKNSGVLLGTATVCLIAALLIAVRFGIRDGLGQGLVFVGIVLGQLTLGGFASSRWPRRVPPYKGGGGGSLTLACFLLLIWGVPTVLGVLFAEEQVGLTSLMLPSASYAILYWLCRPRAGHLLETKFWAVRTRLQREEF
jgi:hypothetical protein